MVLTGSVLNRLFWLGNSDLETGIIGFGVAREGPEINPPRGLSVATCLFVANLVRYPELNLKEKNRYNVV